MRFLLSAAVLLLLAPHAVFAAGAQSYSTPGTYTFTVPTYTTLTVKLWGGGGAGGGSWGNFSGSASTFNGTLSAGGGSPGDWKGGGTWQGAVGGAGGVASGGGTNTNGTAGSNGAAQSTGGPGGTAPNGGSGGYPASGSGSAPGGGGGGFQVSGGQGTGNGGGGGSGAYVERTYTVGQLTPGASITVVVGSGGGVYASGQGGSGAAGRVDITWTGSNTQTFSSPGTYAFTVPHFSSFSAEVWGAGGGGGSKSFFAYGNQNGSAGSNSAFGSVVGYGGGAGISYGGNSGGAGGAGGSAAGGDTNTAGGSGGGGWCSTAPSGNVAGAGGSGAGPNGGAGGAAGASAPAGYGASGAAPGGGGGGANAMYSGRSANIGCGAGGGGGGGYAKKTYATSTLTANSSVTIVVGSGGAGASGYHPNAFTNYGNGGSGSSGRVYVTWVDAAPACTVTVDVNPLTYGGSTTLRWTSSGATTFYINNVGYVTPNTTGSATVGPLTTTSYNGTAESAAGTVNCYVTLSVEPAAAPTCSVSASPATIYVGQTTDLVWTSSNATSCTGTNFATGNGTSGTVSVSPSSSTTYTASCTGGGGTTQCSGTGSGGLGAEVAVNPACTPSTTYTCNGQTIQQTDISNFCAQTVTDVTTCVAPTFCSTGSSVCHTAQITAGINSSPKLLKTGGRAVISWTSLHATSCTVTGNGDSWTGLSDSQLSLPITETVTYTLNCLSDFSSFTDSVTIKPLPSWQEI